MRCIASIPQNQGILSRETSTSSTESTVSRRTNEAQFSADRSLARVIAELCHGVATRFLHGGADAGYVMSPMRGERGLRYIFGRISLSAEIARSNAQDLSRGTPSLWQKAGKITKGRDEGSSRTGFSHRPIIELPNRKELYNRCIVFFIHILFFDIVSLSKKCKSFFSIYGKKED